MPENLMTFPRRRFLRLSGWGALMMASPKFASAQLFSTRIGNLAIDFDARRITINERVYLTSKQHKLLKLLWLHKGKHLSREVILKHLYGGVDEPEPRIIDVFVATLRFKIFKATAGRGSIKIDNVAGRGYVLIET